MRFPAHRPLRRRSERRFQALSNFTPSRHLSLHFMPGNVLPLSLAALRLLFGDVERIPQPVVEAFDIGVPWTGGAGPRLADQEESKARYIAPLLPPPSVPT